MKNNTEYSVTRESKTGMIIKRAGLVAGVVVSLGIGSVVMYNNFQESKREEAAYSYDASYDTYSEQIESVMDIDLSEDMESELNKMQDIRETVNDYLNETGLISKAQAAQILYQEKSTIINWGLDVVKMSLANRCGNSPEDYTILPPDSGDGEYIAYCKNGDNVALSSDEIGIAQEVIGLQRLTDNSSNVSEKDTEKLLVTRVDNIIQTGGKIITEISNSRKAK